MLLRELIEKIIRSTHHVACFHVHPQVVKEDERLRVQFVEHVVVIGVVEQVEEGCVPALVRCRLVYKIYVYGVPDWR